MWECVRIRKRNETYFCLVNAKLTFNRVNVSCAMKTDRQPPLLVRVGGLETPGKVCRSRKSSECSKTHFSFPVVLWLLSIGSCIWSYSKPACDD